MLLIVMRIVTVQRMALYLSQQVCSFLVPSQECVVASQILEHREEGGEESTHYVHDIFTQYSRHVHAMFTPALY